MTMHATLWHRLLVGGGLFLICFGGLPIDAGAVTGAPVATMYWADASLGTIDRANIDGSAKTSLVSGLVNPQDVKLDLAGGKMYWVQADGHKIRRANLDGSNMEDLVSTVAPISLALDLSGGKMYWSDPFITGKIQRANLNGSAIEDVISSVSDREGIALDVAAGKIYWTNRSFALIQRANTDGSSVESLVTTGLADPRGLALDLTAGKMYWAEVGTHKIQRAHTDGSGVQDLVTGLSAPDGIALDTAGGKMYWTDFVTHKIQRANLDGTSVEDLITGLGIPTGITLGPSLTPVRTNQTISFAPLPSKVLGEAHFTVSATASSGLPVTFAASGPCLISGSTVSLTATGVCTIIASQAGNSIFNPAPDVSQKFDVLSPGQFAQGVIALISRMGLSSGTVTSLSSQLQAYIASTQGGNHSAACGQLGAFGNHVEAQLGKQIPAIDAFLLLTDGARLGIASGC